MQVYQRTLIPSVLTREVQIGPWERGCNQRSLLRGRHDNRLIERSSAKLRSEELNILRSSFVFRLFSYRYIITMSVRTYNPSVLIGNWNEDVCLEEVSIFEQFRTIYCEG